ncbi:MULTISPECIES: hypothetical protein [Haloferax]|uniref:Uncharacterized protein n=1 Tax=Haloferax marinum TaxID=2666143 RepID=A0A6A8G9F9_9EURY|nr:MULTISPECIES: hypothetical protein [Haloferax]KAB1198712.1 hypothetical protein Hfx1150_14760 [Haloferax sp. CBA1150]MRW97829.1 hypothetical protein [Haloferax marinum]
MKRITIVGVALAVLVATAGVAAATPGEHAGESSGTDAAQHDDAQHDAAQHDAAQHDDAAQQGPPSELPGPVPDFVSDIHDSVNEFMDGMMDGALGPAVSDHAGGPAPSSN